MRAESLIRAGVLALLVVPSPARGAVGGQEPYKEAGGAPLEYRGPGREAAEPEVEEVVLGWFGPGDPEHPRGGEHWRGALLALEEVNAAGGYLGKPFRLQPGWSENPWGTGVVSVTKMVYEHGAWALLGAIDGAATHLAEQVALKARITLVSSGSTDRTANMASVPWMFSCLPSDAAQAPVLARAVSEASADGSFGIVAATDHDSHAALVDLRRALAALALAPGWLIEFDPVAPDPDALAAQVAERARDTIVILAPPEAGGRLVAGLRRRGFTGRLFGGAGLALAAFGRVAGAAAEGVVAPLLWQPSPEWDSFARMYENRWGTAPDHGAAQSYDAVRLVAQATRRAGLNRPRIRDAVRGMAPWRGVAGLVQWNALGQNERLVGLAMWTNGRLQPIASPESMER